MIPENYNRMYWTADDEEEKEEQPKSDLMMFSKKLEKYFFEKRSVYLWGVVDDKSASTHVPHVLPSVSTFSDSRKRATSNSS